MAAIDYTNNGQGVPCPMGTLGITVTPLATVFNINDFRPVESYVRNDSDIGTESETAGDIEVGMGLMIDDEICRVNSVVLPNITVARGCADTIPQPHSAGSVVWFFSNNASSDGREYLAGDTVAVKASMFTTTGEAVPVANTPPLELTFNWRFARPYPPGDFKCEGSAWFDALKVIEVDATELTFTWAHRDRLLQADQLIEHEESSIGPEVGTTYTARVYDSADNLVRTVTGITGTTWAYLRADALVDLPLATGYIDFCSTRDTLDSYQSYRTDIAVAFTPGRVTEDGTEPRITEDGDIRSQE